ncbi:MAG: hypothetical protein K2X91_07100, partial [Thermoleophilia bacterium]|nr:hypothetical protein [Thermoleophilia bacterium]
MPKAPIKWWKSLARRVGEPGSARVNMVGVALGVGVTSMLALMAGRVAQLQLRPGPKLAAHMSDREVTVKEPARRGDITDRRGRVLAASRFGFYTIVDPEQFPTKGTDEAIIRLAAALGLKPEEIGPRILSRMAANAEVKAARASKGAEVRTVGPAVSGAVDGASDNPGGETSPVDPAGAAAAESERTGPALSRYVPVGGLLDEHRVEIVKALKISGVHLETRQVREVSADDAGSLIGKVGFGDEGLMGSEKLLNKGLQPRSGAFTYTADVKGRPLWVAPDAYKAPVRGVDTALSIDLELQRIAEEELERGVLDCDAAGGRAVIMDPMSGEILAMVDIVRDLPEVRDYDWRTPLKKDDPPVPGERWRIIPIDRARAVNPALGRNRCIEDTYEPGSTF